MHLQQAPHTCGSAQPADPSGQSGRGHSQLCSISLDPPGLLPTNILRAASSFPSSSTTQPQAQQTSQAGMGRALGRAVSALQVADGIVPFPACLGSAEGCGPLM